MNIISLMEIIGTVAFAVSGALVAIEKKLDHYGIAILAMITAVGGGIIRDVLIGLKLPAALENPMYVLISLGTAVLVIGCYKWITKYRNILLLFDAIGLAAFTAIGAEAALSHHVYTPFVVITMATLTGTGGGVLRDVFAKEIPFVFQKEVYAVASIIGACGFMAAYYVLKDAKAAMYISFGITLIIRLVAIKMNWHLAKVRQIEERDEGRK